MVVRFLPAPADPESARRSERSDLAEVIELRTRLTADRGDRARATLTAIEQSVVSVTSEADAATEAVLGDEPGGQSSLGDRSENEGVDAASEAELAAVRLLARRARSSGELRRELLALGHTDADVELVILKCETNLYLDDLGLARVLTEGLRERKRASRSQIRAKLRERMLPHGVIEEALGELDEDDEHLLLREAANARARKMTGLDRTTAERRLLGFLARRGWSGERATRVAREALDNTAARGSVRFR